MSDTDSFDERKFIVHKRGIIKVIKRNVIFMHYFMACLKEILHMDFAFLPHIRFILKIKQRGMS